MPWVPSLKSREDIPPVSDKTPQVPLDGDASEKCHNGSNDFVLFYFADAAAEENPVSEKPLESTRAGNTPTARNTSVFDFSDSPVESPVKPETGKTRKAQAKLERELYLRKNKVDWGDKKQAQSHGRHSVQLHRAARSAKKTYKEDSESVIVLSSDKENSETENEVGADKKLKTKRRASENSAQAASSKAANADSKVEENSIPEEPSPTSECSKQSRRSGSTSGYSSAGTNESRVNRKRTPTSSYKGRRNSFSPAVSDATARTLTTPSSVKRGGRQPLSTPRSSKSARSSPATQCTPTSSRKRMQRTESPGLSPALTKKNPKGETPLQVAVIKVP